MSINAATSSTSSVSSSSSSSQVSSASNSDNAKKSSTESSFKDEMNKVSSKDTKKDENGVEKSDTKVNAVTEKSENTKDKSQLSDSNDLDNQFAGTLEGGIDYSKFASMSIADINTMLSNDISQIINNTSAVTEESALTDTINKTGSGMMSFDFANSVSLTESDADFFINLTQKNDISAQNMISQAQTMINSGVDAAEAKQNVQISQTLLNAINTAKETNQPMRIDFDQNVSVILRIGKDGAVAANFIPGDKAVEQYLKNNIDSLKATFNENDLPYTDLSYSNRGSKQQKENRRNKQ